MSHQYLTDNKKSTNVLIRSMNSLFWALWQVTPTYASKLILRLLFRPKSIRQRPDERANWEKGTAFQIKIHNRTIHGRYWGDGPGVLFVHGWNGRGSQFHRFVESTVSSGHRAIAFDGPAHGESQGSYTTYFEFTDVVRAFLRRDAGMPAEKGIAHSFGAGAVINAVHKEELTPDIVLIAPALALEEFLHDSFQKLGFPFRLFQKLIQSLEKLYGYNLRRDNPHRLLQHVKIPLLVIHDKADKTIPYSATIGSVKNRPNILLHSTEGLGHTKILRESVAIDAAMNHLFSESNLVSNL